MLIHVGVDTVEMKGDGFESKVKLGSKVTKGQLLLTMDLDKIKAAGHRRWLSPLLPTPMILPAWMWLLPAMSTPAMT